MEPTPSSTQEEIPSGDIAVNTTSGYGTTRSPSVTTYRCPTLTAFLQQLNLTQYHNCFVEVAGVGENDLEQFLGFDEAEIKEVLSSVSMKPFHSAAFKKGIRELRQALSTNLNTPGLVPSLSTNVYSVPSVYHANLLQVREHSNPESLISGKILLKTEKPPFSTRENTPIRSLDTSQIKPSPVTSRISLNITNDETTTPSPSIHSPSPMQEIQDALGHSTTLQQQIIKECPASPLSSSSVTCDNDNSNDNPTINVAASKDVIIHHAIIYGKNSNRQLTSYEQAINRAATELALSDPTLVANKGALFEKAKAKLLSEGYTYKRGQSRSKLNPNAPKPGMKTSRANLRLKRNQHAAQTSENRIARITELERKLQSKENQYEIAQELKRVKAAQGDTEGLEKAEMALEELERERNEITKEIASLKSKERKHRWYEQRKKERMDSGFGENELDTDIQQEDLIIENQ
ncbi:5235_t:CDS:2 [Acaulospora morrowiae]|uniref:5235_t:CDS:1 n=1 Tax=Acaulospora morrowiae TaxID=94023 RepID=A0A9N9FN92_9GLOM|nr:5235_t:CDS:2 [Acaulospora morrowiae]